MQVRDNLCARILRTPRDAADLDSASWDVLIRQARRADVLARLAWLLESAGIWQRIPDRPRRHLAEAATVATRRAEATRIELAHIRAALKDLPCPVILLKGAAYLAAGLPASSGRVFSDIDLLVPKPFIEQVELALKFQGWSASYHSAYDQRYYRQWMHEIPPLKHLARGSVIDLHHAILPPTARIQTSPDALFHHAQLLAGNLGFHVLNPADMVLHSAAHLFHEGEFQHGLRDIVDLDALLRHFSQDQKFWETLARRSRELNLSRPLHYALRYAQRIMDTPAPKVLLDQDRPLSIALMDALFGRALAPDHPSCDDRLTWLARGMLYVRGHWLRMPLYLLIPHLIRKALRLGTENPSPKPVAAGADQH